MEDDHVDRPDVEAGRPVQLTGTNRSFGLNALISQCPSGRQGWALQKRPLRKRPLRKRPLQKDLFSKAFFRKSPRPDKTIRKTSFASRVSPAWWLRRSAQTRSHPELGRQTLQRQWYYVSRPGRVGRRQACKTREFPLTMSDLRLSGGPLWSSLIAFGARFALAFHASRRRF